MDGDGWVEGYCENKMMIVETQNVASLPQFI